MFTQTHTHTHTCTFTQTHRHTRSHRHTHTHTHISHAPMHTHFSHTLLHAHAPTRTRTHTHTCPHAHAPTRTRAHTHTSTQRTRGSMIAREQFNKTLKNEEEKQVGEGRRVGRERERVPGQIVSSVSQRQTQTEREWGSRQTAQRRALRCRDAPGWREGERERERELGINCEKGERGAVGFEYTHLQHKNKDTLREERREKGKRAACLCMLDSTSSCLLINRALSQGSRPCSRSPAP